MDGTGSQLAAKFSKYSPLDSLGFGHKSFREFQRFMTNATLLMFLFMIPACVLYLLQNKANTFLLKGYQQMGLANINRTHTNCI